MAKGAFVGVQGVTPDLRPSIQMAQESVRQKRAEEAQKEQQRVEQERWEKEVELKEKQIASTLGEGVKDRMKREHAYWDDLSKRLQTAKDDVSKESAFAQFASEYINNIAYYREQAELSTDPATSMKYRQMAENQLNTLNLITNCAVDTSTLLPDLNKVETYKDEWQSIAQGISQSDWTFQTKNVDGKQVPYITNGYITFGMGANGVPQFTIGEEGNAKTFASPDALRQYISSNLIFKDDSYIKDISSIFDIQISSETTTINGNTEKKYDLIGYQRALDEALDQSVLGNYNDDYTYQEALNDGNAPLVNLFRTYGGENNAKTIKDLKNAISSNAKGRLNIDTQVVEKDRPKAVTPLNSSVNYSDAQSRTNAIQRLSSSNNVADQNAAEVIAGGGAIGDALNDLIINKNDNALGSFGYNTVIRNTDGTITISGSTSNTRINENEEGETTSYSESERLSPVTFNPSTSEGMQSAVQALITQYNKTSGANTPLTLGNVAPMFNYNGYEQNNQEADGNNPITILKQAIQNNDDIKDTDDNITINGKSQDADKAIRQSINEFLSNSGYFCDTNYKLGNANLEIHIKNDSDSEIVKTFYVNLNLSDEEKRQGGWRHNGKKWRPIENVLDEIEKSYSNNKRDSFQGNIFRTGNSLSNSTSSLTINNNSKSVPTQSSNNSAVSGSFGSAGGGVVINQF